MKLDQSEDQCTQDQNIDEDQVIRLGKPQLVNVRLC